MPSTTPAPAKLVKEFLAHLKAFRKRNVVKSDRAFAKIAGVSTSTQLTWKKGRKLPCLETIQRVSERLDAVDQYATLINPF